MRELIVIASLIVGTSIVTAGLSVLILKITGSVILPIIIGSVFAMAVYIGYCAWLSRVPRVNIDYESEGSGNIKELSNDREDGLVASIGTKASQHL